MLNGFVVHHGLAELNDITAPGMLGLASLGDLASPPGLVQHFGLAALHGFVVPYDLAVLRELRCSATSRRPAR